MADLDRVTSTMATLMPLFRRAFEKGAAQHTLSTLMRVVPRESALNVRLPDPKWPGPSDLLASPRGATETALRLCREMQLNTTSEQAEVEEDAEIFGKETAEIYVQAVLDQLVAGAGRPRQQPTDVPTVDALQQQALQMGIPCKVLAGASVFTKHEKLSDPYIEKVVLQPHWPSQRALLVSMTSTGPWVEELEPTFVLEWEFGAGSNAKVQAHRRLFLHDLDQGFLFEC